MSLLASLFYNLQVGRDHTRYSGLSAECHTLTLRLCKALRAHTPKLERKSEERERERERARAASQGAAKELNRHVAGDGTNAGTGTGTGTEKMVLDPDADVDCGPYGDFEDGP